MLSELFEKLPEVGDPEKPKLVFFFDEAHLPFNDLPPVLQDKIEQVVRLIRSKGVGVYFVTQNPLDVHEVVLGQLGNRVQHALRAFTPKDQKSVRAAAETFRANPKLDVAKVITELGVGEAPLSFLDEKGTPQVVEQMMVIPPHRQIGLITPEQRQQIIGNSVVAGVYEKTVDPESPYEKLKGGADQPGRASAGSAQMGQAAHPAGKPWYENLPSIGLPNLGGSTRGGRRGDSLMEAVMKSAVRTRAATSDDNLCVVFWAAC